MTCSGCGAPMQIDDERDCFSCAFCGNQHCPEPDDDGVRILRPETAFNCPVCAATLAEGSLAGQRLLHCTQCGGLLIDMQDLVPLVASLRSERGSFIASPRPIDMASLSRQLRCPKCMTAMDTHPYGGPGNLVIDSCEPCEVNWLDRGELSRIVSAPDHEYC